MSEQNSRKPSTKKKENARVKELIEFLKNHSENNFTYNQLCKKLHCTGKKSKQALSDSLDILEEAGAITKNENGAYQIKAEKDGMVGVVDFVNPKYAFIIVEDREKDLRVLDKDLGSAVDGDTVKVRLMPGGGRNSSEAVVTEVLERKRDEFVGRIELSNRYAFVIPDNRKMHTDIFVPNEHINGAEKGDKVIVKVTKWQTPKDKNPLGIVTRILGQSGEHETEMHSIMAEYDLPFEFPDEVLAESEDVDIQIHPKEIKRRRDMRNVTTFTIDPEDAKDFDDAISIEKLDNGHYEIGVHIADVTHYVQLKTKLEKEAYKRATSVYLVDRTIPMLPEKLSNGVCSLRPNEEKLTMSAVFEMDDMGHVHKEWFGRTVTYSNRRFSYEDAQEVIVSGKGDYAEEIKILNDIAHKLRAERFKSGAISFETTEVTFKLAPDGKPLGVFPKKRFDAHKLVEDWMLLANKKVAEYVYKQKSSKDKHKTMVYRIHGNPNMEKLENFAGFARRFGYEIKLDPNNLSSSINKLIDDVEGKPEGSTLQSLAIRTMAKAVYSTEEKGHFGLAFKHYTHFTSPIRRYPDMMVHRLLMHYLNEGKSVSEAEYEDYCKHSSEQEKVAADAERASIKYKQVEYVLDFTDKVMEGMVTGVTDFGVFVEIIETKCEGMIRISDLADDYYELDAENYRIIGKKNKRIIAFGQTLNVRVKGGDLDRRTIDLELVDDPAKQNRSKGNSKGPARGR